MNKKLMMVAVLMGALSLGACVDNKESDSVVAVRTAKAAQLNSIAAMNNAEADKTKAMAAYEKAKAEIEQAKADIDKARLEIDIEAAKTDAEAALQDAKVRLETARASLIASLDNVDKATKARVTTLLGEANTVLGHLNTTRSNLVLEKNNLLLLNFDLITVETAKEIVIIDAKKDKVNAESLIEEYKKHSQDDILNAQKNADVATATEKGLKATLDEKEAAFTSATAAYTAANVAVSKTLYGEVKAAKPAYFTSEIVAARENVAFTHENGAGGFITKSVVNKDVANISLFEADITQAARSLDIANATQADAEKALTDKKAESGYTTAQSNVTKAQQEYDAATTSAEKSTKKAALDAAEATLKAYTQTEESDVFNAKESVKTAKGDLKNAKEYLAAVSGANLAAYTASIEKVVAARDAVAKAEIARDIAKNTYDVQAALAQSLRDFALGFKDFAELIQTEKDNIAKADKEIADVSTILTAKDLITKSEKNIEKYELELKVYEEQYASYMTQIKALIGE